MYEENKGEKQMRVKWNINIKAIIYVVSSIPMMFFPTVLYLGLEELTQGIFIFACMLGMFGWLFIIAIMLISED